MDFLAFLPFKNLINDLYSLATEPIKKEFEKTKTEDALIRIFGVYDKIKFVKTIWQIDKSINLYDFYYPIKIYNPDAKEDISEYKCPILLTEEKNCIVLEGIAGQGKSIYLRYLCSNFVKEGKGFPIFLQLRNVDKKTTLKDLLISEFDKLSINFSSNTINYLLDDNKLVFLLDGFDEINQEYRLSTIKFLEDFIEKYDGIRIIVSSRPHSDIQGSPFFNIYKLMPLDLDNRTEMISHLCKDEEQSERLIVSLKRKPNIAGILTTPLLVTLLIITYKAEQEVPNNLSGFYDKLFVTLLTRHDRSKPGFRRERKCDIGDMDFENIFSIFCFLSLKQYKISLSENEAVILIKTALAKQKLSRELADKYKEDLVSTTCLLIKDGFDYFFLHKTIPEFFTARFIKNENDDIAQLFYKQFLSKDIPENWYQTLSFLQEIDTYRFYKYLLLPYMFKTFKLHPEALPRTFPKLSLHDFIDIIGIDSNLIIKKSLRTEIIFCGISLRSNNWYVINYLHHAIQNDITNFINSLSDLSKYTIPDGITPLKAFFEKSSFWLQFVDRLSSNSETKNEYGRIFNIVEYIKFTDERCLDILDINC